MDIKELLKSGDLNKAIETVTQQIKNNPTQPGLRTALFELLCLTGEWDRAEKQLQVVSHQDSSLSLGVQVFINNIKAERSRQQLFEKGVAPHFLTEPPRYADMLVEAIQAYNSGDLAKSRQLMDQADEERPVLSGLLNGKPFQDFRDASDFTAPILELIIHDKYTWLPWENVKSLELKPLRQLRDIVWISAKIESKTGAIGEVFLPALYPNSFKHADPAVQLGKKTDWSTKDEEVFVPAGSRLLCFDDRDLSIYDAQSIQFSVEEASS
jgi:type VI secretion system protein ImpE